MIHETISETCGTLPVTFTSQSGFESSLDYVDSMNEWSDPFYGDIASKLPRGTKPSDFVTNPRITAPKLGGSYSG